MVSFLRSSKAVTAALLASSLANTDAYGRLYYHNCPSTAMALRMLRDPFSGPSLLSRDSRRVMHDMDEMLEDAMVGDFNNMFYNPPVPLPRVSRPSPYLLQRGAPALNALASITRPGNAHGIVQDDKQLKITMDVQGAEASDIHLHLDDDSRVLRISGETKCEEGGISVHSRFDRAFSLNRDVDTSMISARMDDGVLTIIAPKYEEGRVKDNVRRIDIVENKKVEGDKAVSDQEVDTPYRKEEDSPKMEQLIDDTLIDLDLNKD
ncbi:hypothetical protein ACHAXA_007489 [Cyclostephanos tholiformis]|uniref:SHSP domain-containing protein n=1 Tax=Cyclostephanos tholiformis TaxID=382380 RepID=A0ABD3RCU7_9STRA